MRIYKISATQGNISFTQTIKADSYKHARAKFMLQNNKQDIAFFQPEVVIEKITRRY